MDIDQIARLIDLFGRSSLAELDYSDERLRIRLARTAAAGPGDAASAVHAAPRAAVRPADEAPPAPGPGGTEDAAPKPPAETAHVIAAGLAGTFYRAPSPGAPPFVSEGDVVEEGQVLALLEAMKMLNPVEADRAGRIAQILVEDGTPVGAGAALVTILPEG